MCGIGGIKRMLDEEGNIGPPIRDWQIRMLACSLEWRGNDATGIALMTDKGKIFVHKDHEPAWRYVTGEGYKKFIADHLKDNIVTALVHTRKATKGTPFKNENNHPMYNGLSAVVHNGFVFNDDELFKKLEVERSAETDSDAIRAIIDIEGITKGAITEMNQINGSVAAACVHPKMPDKLLLLRSGNPLILASDGSGQLFWASDKRSIHRAARPWVRRYNLLMQLHNPALAFIPMANNSGWIIGAKGLEFHDEFTVTSTFGRRIICEVSGNWQERREKHRVKALPPKRTEPVETAQASEPPGTPDYVFCPNPKCQAILHINEEFRNDPLFKLRCKECRTNLDKALKAPTN